MSTLTRRICKVEARTNNPTWAFAALTDEQLDARIKELSAKAGLPLPDEAIKIYGSLAAYIKVLRKSMEKGGHGIDSIVQARAAS